MIETKGIIKIFGKKHNQFIALKDINIQIPSKSSVAIIGKSGSGKSTLMHVLSGLDTPDSGQVLVEGQDILQMKASKIDKFRASSIGFIFQAFFVSPNETCYQNVALPLEIAGVPRRERKEMILEAIDQVELTDKINEKAKNLSGGQKQRLAIARAIVNRPNIIFADEPTGNLDSATGEKVEDLLFHLNKKFGSTLIIVTHDHTLAARCDRQIHIKDGQVEKLTVKKSDAKKAGAKV
jgi:putative ABC transport system ATP-binding protein